MIHFALVQLSKKHTEIFGTFIEIIQYYNWELTIYYDKDNDPYTFLNYYSKLFETSLNVIPTTQLQNNYNKYDFFLKCNSVLLICIFVVLYITNSLSFLVKRFF